MAIRRHPHRAVVTAACSFLVLALAGPLTVATVHAAGNPPLPKPARPIGPGAFHPLDSFGPTPNDNVVLKWNDQALAAIRATAPPPPVSARALAIMNTGMYNAWSAYDATAVPTQRAGWSRRPADERTLERKSMAISYAAHRTLSNLFPSLAATFTTFRTNLGYSTEPTGEPDDPAAVGTAAANAVIEARRNDGANQAGDAAGGNGTPYGDYTGYTPTSPPAALSWQPLPGQSFIVPHWQRVTPFALTSASQFLPPGPQLRKSDGSYQKAVDEIIKFSAKLDDGTKVRAEYWADGPRTEQPPGHWMLFAGAVSRKNGHTIDQDAKLNFAISNALHDAGITSWNAKRRYDFIRPITAVRTLKAGTTIRAWAGPGRGTREIPAEQFTSYVGTPPHPDYVSGHSTFSGAAARVLRLFTGNDILNLSATLPAGSSVVEPGTVPAAAVRLSWPTYTAAADEAGLSRMLGGIHFRDANRNGMTLGTSVGSNAWSKARTYFTGTAVPAP
ncbi:MAG TPA: vanadium-dependent haloperoxidase [Actinoplanes sp.]|nr:vanadium-dependent haloperoxidase [Actinoplanes sp.]